MLEKKNEGNKVKIAFKTLYAKKVKKNPAFVSKYKSKS